MIDINKLRRDETYPMSVKIEIPIMKQLDYFCQENKVKKGALVGELIKEFLTERDALNVKEENE